MRRVNDKLGYQRRFEWVLAGHGERMRLPADEMRAQLQALVERRRSTRVVP